MTLLLLLRRTARYQWPAGLAVFAIVLIALLLVSSGVQTTQTVSAAVVTNTSPIINPNSPSRVALLSQAELAGAGLAALERTHEAHRVAQWRPKRGPVEKAAAAKSLSLQLQDDAASTSTPPLSKADEPAISRRHEVAETDELNRADIAARQRVTDLEAKLGQLREIDTELHPDVVDAKQEYLLAMRDLQSLQRRSDSSTAAGTLSASSSGIKPEPMQGQEESQAPLQAKSVVVRQRAHATDAGQAREHLVKDVTSLPLQHEPLIGSPAAAEFHTSESNPRVVRTRGVPVLPLVLSALIAGASAALLREWLGDHIDEDLLMSRDLTAGATFGGVIPRMDAR